MIRFHVSVTSNKMAQFQISQPRRSTLLWKLQPGWRIILEKTAASKQTVYLHLPLSSSSVSGFSCGAHYTTIPTDSQGPSSASDALSPSVNRERAVDNGSDCRYNLVEQERSSVADLQEALVHLDSLVEQQKQVDNIPGIAIAVTDRKKLLRVAAYGLADVAAKTPVTADTLFEIGSITKSFTAIALLQLHEEGLVDLHAPVTRYLPWFSVPSKYEPITLHHLLSHTAGLIMGTEFSTEARYEVWALRETEVAAPPGTFFYYSNVGYKALGLVLEQLLGQEYGQIIRERILDPLGMAATDAVITHETRKRLAVGFETLYDDRPAHPSHPLAPAAWFETGTADGSIAATAADMATYLRMLMNHGQGPHRRILSEAGFRLMTQRVIEPPQGGEEHGTFYGYGLNISEDGGHILIGHDGGMVGYYAAILADLDDGLGVVVLTNAPGEPGRIAWLALQVLRAAHHGQSLPSLPPIPDPTRIENAADYAGTYRAEGGTFTITDEEMRLVMQHGAERTILQQSGPDRFYVCHPDFSRFLLRFGREDGQVVEAFHGPAWYVHERYAGLSTGQYPTRWVAYTGHYRSHNPWFSNFRIVLRKGTLVLSTPWGDEQTLVAMGGSLFRVGDDARSPERIRFDTLVDGRAIRANLSGCDYYRTFTP
jgi:CubicO group peptidase (beta-lactamase class C family)